MAVRGVHERRRREAGLNRNTAIRHSILGTAVAIAVLLTGLAAVPVRADVFQGNGAWTDDPFFRDSGVRQGQPSIDIVGGIAFPAGKVNSSGVKAKLGPAAAVSANFFIAGPLWGGLRTEWTRHNVDRAGSHYISLDTVAVMAQLEYRLKEKGSPFGGYIGMGFGGNINMADVTPGLAVPGSGTVASATVKNSLAVRTAIGLEWEFTPRYLWVLDLSWKGNGLGKTAIKTSTGSTVLEPQNFSVYQILTGPRFNF